MQPLMLWSPRYDRLQEVVERSRNIHRSTPRAHGDGAVCRPAPVLALGVAAASAAVDVPREIGPPFPSRLRLPPRWPRRESLLRVRQEAPSPPHRPFVGVIASVRNLDAQSPAPHHGRGVTCTMPVRACACRDSAPKAARVRRKSCLVFFPQLYVVGLLFSWP